MRDACADACAYACALLRFCSAQANVNIREARRAAPSHTLHARMRPADASFRVSFAPQFYEKDGLTLPGAKGIALTPAQWAVLVAHAPQVEAALKALGE